MPLLLQSLLSKGLIDRVAIALSGLCAVHCIGTALLLGVLASAGGVLHNPLIHETGLVMAIGMGALALGYGAMAHGSMLPAAIGSLGLGVMAGALTMGHGSEESLYTILGVSILALGHYLNRRAGLAFIGQAERA